MRCFTDTAGWLTERLGLPGSLMQVWGLACEPWPIHPGRRMPQRQCIRQHGGHWGEGIASHALRANQAAVAPFLSDAERQDGSNGRTRCHTVETCLQFWSCARRGLKRAGDSSLSSPILPFVKEAVSPWARLTAGQLLRLTERQSFSPAPWYYYPLQHSHR